MRASELEDVFVTLLRLAVTDLPQDVVNSLEQALKIESNSTAQSQLEAIIENIKLARQRSIPMCQDTGIQIFYLTVGSKFPLISEIPQILENAVRKGTQEIPLRPNTVNPLFHKNPGDNTGRYIPWINWKIVKGNDLQITAFPKGGGSENVCQLRMLTPGQGLKGMKQFVIDAVIETGAKACPPIIIGIGIGGGADICMKLAKEQLLRPVGQRHPDQRIADMEEELLEAINKTGIGPMGLGGDTTSLDVHIDFAMRHPASFPVGLAVQCWAARRASATITSEGRVEFTSHRVE
ncbi:MAG: fumarate hydratase [Candidatus Hermodarchaeota archaeon]|nr:fumarate hydratase [Candidatus Hermodarchaeota archaeon]